MDLTEGETTEAEDLQKGTTEWNGIEEHPEPNCCIYILGCPVICYLCTCAPEEANERTVMGRLFKCLFIPAAQGKSEE